MEKVTTRGIVYSCEKEKTISSAVEETKVSVKVSL